MLEWVVTLQTNNIIQKNLVILELKLKEKQFCYTIWETENIKMSKYNTIMILGANSDISKELVLILNQKKKLVKQF